MHRFYKFCVTYNVTSPFPLSEQLLCTYASYLADQQLASQTIKSYLSALRSWQILLGLSDPREKSSLPVLKRVQAGISRMRATERLSGQDKTPHNSSPLEEDQTGPGQVVKPSRARDLGRAFVGFFRLGEFLPDSVGSFNESTCLSWGDVAVDNRSSPTMKQVHLKKLKCDQFGAGTDIVMQVTRDELCPVSAIIDYLRLRGDRKGAFFLDPNGMMVTKSWFVEQIRSVLSSVGTPQHQYAGHSCRIGIH